MIPRPGSPCRRAIAAARVSVWRGPARSVASSGDDDSPLRAPRTTSGSLSTVADRGEPVQHLGGPRLGCHVHPEGVRLGHRESTSALARFRYGEELGLACRRRQDTPCTGPAATWHVITAHTQWAWAAGPPMSAAGQALRMRAPRSRGPTATQGQC